MTFAYYLFIYLLFFGCVACGILVFRPEIKPAPLALEAGSLNHWIAREFPDILIF